MRKKPEILATQEVAKSRLFRVEQLELRFSNGVQRTYERLRGKPGGLGAVMIVAMLDAENFVLIEEYCAGTESYELTLPKGLIDPGEDALMAANRELQEEAGYAARELEWVTELSLSPGYMSQRIQVVLARDLYPSRLEGDEPEPMGVETASLNDLLGLLARSNFSEGRALAALYVVRDLLQQRGLIKPTDVKEAP
ncbi:ADP compounds hydrolase NudE [Thiopseudomonas alkaliphila]|uniref:ADP compounds hydrolase NudE n=1 Tax=Thiopseudomonas alkaliphila TaxID=1697053 RepID=A0AAW7DSK7_9GAMM|nr:ADP compounds hydrolase NudE [Thiopseudomonas alkaliphila]MDM1696809.1 ADP compounds hydrolase NudE [Thiopseudomonas alkaliphila]